MAAVRKANAVGRRRRIINVSKEIERLKKVVNGIDPEDENSQRMSDLVAEWEGLSASSKAPISKCRYSCFDCYNEIQTLTFVGQLQVAPRSPRIRSERMLVLFLHHNARVLPSLPSPPSTVMLRETLHSFLRTRLIIRRLRDSIRRTSPKTFKITVTTDSLVCPRLAMALAPQALDAAASQPASP
jgi:hypothetical protein